MYRFANIEFNQAAFRHGVTEENIRCALNHPEYEGPIDNNEIDEHTVNVFHAMKCRNIFLHLLDE
jgi:hypothetical protein